MRSQSYNDAITLAKIRAYKGRTEVDVYQTGEGYDFQITQLRKSKKYVNRLSYEKGQVIIRDAQGKKIDTFSPEIPNQKAETAKGTKGKGTKYKKG